MKTASITVRHLEAKDLGAIKPILEAWVPFAQEVETDLDEMSASLAGDLSLFLVAQIGEEVVGMAGLRASSPQMRALAQSSRTLELVHLYVSPTRRGLGVGSTLMCACEDAARECGARELALNSGPRYKDSAWGFYDHLQGFERIATLKDIYGPGFDAPVWRKLLV